MNLVSSRNPQRHMIFRNDETEIGRWLGREFPDHWELFVYFHHDTGNYVIGAWCNSDKTAFRDVLNLGPFGIMRLDRDQLQGRLNPAGTDKDLSDLLEQQEYAEARRMTDESYIDSEQRKPRKIQVTAT